MPEQNGRAERLRALYEAYLDEAAAAERGKGFFAGAFGLKGGPADDPCHERFAERLQALLADFAEERPGSCEARALLEQVFAPPPKGCPKSAYWMLLAVHGTAEGLIPALGREDARALRESYRGDYPRHRRLPVQDRILRLLEKAAQ